MNLCLRRETAESVACLGWLVGQACDLMPEWTWQEVVRLAAAPDGYVMSLGVESPMGWKPIGYLMAQLLWDQKAQCKLAMVHHLWIDPGRRGQTIVFWKLAHAMLEGWAQVNNAVALTCLAMPRWSEVLQRKFKWRYCGTYQNRDYLSFRLPGEGEGRMTQGLRVAGPMGQ